MTKHEENMEKLYALHNKYESEGLLYQDKSKKELIEYVEKANRLITAYTKMVGYLDNYLTFLKSSFNMKEYGLDITNYLDKETKEK